MAGRPRKQTLILASLDDCITAMGNLLKAQAELDHLTADRDTAVAEASARFESDIELWRKYAAEQTDAMQTFYMAHVSELEKDGRRSVQLPNGVMGRRISSGRVAPLNKSWTWKAILARVQSLFPGKFVRQAEVELDKDLIHSGMTPEQLESCGMKIAKDEKFYAEPARLPDPAEVSK